METTQTPSEHTNLEEGDTRVIEGWGGFMKQKGRKKGIVFQPISETPFHCILITAKVCHPTFQTRKLQIRLVGELAEGGLDSEERAGDSNPG